MNTNLGNCHFSHTVYCVSKTTLLWLAISSTLINQFLYFFVDNKVVLLSTYRVQILFLAWPFRFRDTVYSITEKTQFLGSYFHK